MSAAETLNSATVNRILQERQMRVVNHRGRWELYDLTQPGGKPWRCRDLEEALTRGLETADARRK